MVSMLLHVRPKPAGVRQVYQTIVLCRFVGFDQNSAYSSPAIGCCLKEVCQSWFLTRRPRQLSVFSREVEVVRLKIRLHG
jgi:hypothetical protein